MLGPPAGAASVPALSDGEPPKYSIAELRAKGRSEVVRVRQPCTPYPLLSLTKLRTRASKPTVHCFVATTRRSQHCSYLWGLRGVVLVKLRLT